MNRKNQAPLDGPYKDTSGVMDEMSEQFFREIDIQFLVHELKDPIAVIETGARTLISKQEKFGALNERQERIVKRVLRNAVKAREMLHGLLEVGRSESGCFFTCRFKFLPTVQTVLLNSLECMAPRMQCDIDDIKSRDDMAAFLAENGIVLSHSPQMGALELEQDEKKFHQIFGNIVKNALHHRRRRIEITMALENDFLFIDVADDGPGIDSDHHETIFKRYQQVKGASQGTRTGHGLGLAGARIMARGLGGDIKVISSKGEGATFRLVLPVSRGVCD